ncbi:hypothetical protein MTP04_38870 [Lysinibacillus sp. PLM2]|nr:hypothetical protein MTP04_38870 [Lysinibacillus sp. PLM2]
MLRAIIVDDEEIALISLEKLLESFSEVKVLNKFNNDDELLSYIKKEKIDVAFLDIEMGKFNGLDLAEAILSMQPTIHIVFVTAHSEYAVQAFELNSIDYLLKPVSLKRLQKTITRVKEKLHQSEDMYINANLIMYSNDRLNMYSFDNKLHNIPEVECYVYEN